MNEFFALVVAMIPTAIILAIIGIVALFASAIHPACSAFILMIVTMVAILTIPLSQIKRRNNK